jgi:hypothetical protein
MLVGTVGTLIYNQSKILFSSLKCRSNLTFTLRLKMLFYIFLAFVSYLLYTVVNRIVSLRRNIALVKSWGLPYVVLRKL